MTETATAARYSLRNVQELLGLSRTVVTGLIREGFVAPVPGRRHEYRFSLRDLMLLRTAYALQQACIPPRRIFRALNSLRDSLPAELPLTGLRISAIGDQVVVRDQRGPWQADTGQLLMDFEVAERRGAVMLMERIGPGAAARDDADQAVDCFERGEDAERSNPEAAEQAYRQAIALDPSLVRAYVNLGALLSEAGRSAETATLYEQAAQRGVDDATLQFNHGVALEDQGRDEEAIARYRQALQLDPECADAHYNAARLLERQGDGQGALRHLSAYRRLQGS